MARPLRPPRPAETALCFRLPIRIPQRLPAATTGSAAGMAGWRGQAFASRKSTPPGRHSRLLRVPQAFRAMPGATPTGPSRPGRPQAHLLLREAWQRGARPDQARRSSRAAAAAGPVFQKASHPAEPHQHVAVVDNFHGHACGDGGAHQSLPLVAWQRWAVAAKRADERAAAIRATAPAVQAISHRIRREAGVDQQHLRLA